MYLYSHLSFSPPSLPSSTSLLREGIPEEESENQLPKEKLLLLTSCQPVIDFISACDFLLYQCIVDFLIPDVLRPIPGTLTQAIRNFAKSLEMWLTSTLQGYNPSLIKSKVCAFMQKELQCVWPIYVGGYYNCI